MRHVAKGVNVNQRADDRDEQDEDHRQLIELEGHIDLEATGEHP